MKLRLVELWCHIKEDPHIIAEEAAKILPFPIRVHVRLHFAHILQPNQHVATTECKSRHETPASMKPDIRGSQKRKTMPLFLLFSFCIEDKWLLFAKISVNMWSTLFAVLNNLMKSFKFFCLFPNMVSVTRYSP